MTEIVFYLLDWFY